MPKVSPTPERSVWLRVLIVFLAVAGALGVVYSPNPVLGTLVVALVLGAVAMPTG